MLYYIMAKTRFLSQELSRILDERLMGEFGFAIEQLMELAGLSVAEVVQKEFQSCRVLVVCGPGNNGGDGLVAARHLHHFGYFPTVVYPKSTENPLFLRLMTQCRNLDIDIVQDLPDLNCFDLVLDAIFGFSFKGDIRPPFDRIIQTIKNAGKQVVSVDIPSGWDVEKGNISGQGLDPQVLVSLSAPKPCSQFFTGSHYLGGRFVPPRLASELQIDLPLYLGSSQSLKL
jgi:NAD(P)H-hydrate epimerase